MKDFLNTLTSWFFWMLIGVLIVGISIQLYYLNRALDLFNTGLVTALLYVFFTGFVLIASAILFREWMTLNPMDYVELFLALILITIGVFMMTVLKDLDFSWKTLTTVRSAANSPGLLRGSEVNEKEFDARARNKRSRFKPKQSPSVRKSPDARFLLPVNESWSSDSSELDTAPPPELPFRLSTPHDRASYSIALDSGTVDPVLTTTSTTDRGSGPNHLTFSPVMPSSKHV
ncbi:unnamed protein product [Echinostoma caproni]|uniref:Uncharacterized protein n=1 Tax=Echinostoma caproni TaxID=27848 RepID=A0A3P8KVM6_9TREM|nr:unnamed protein product [Echinostoma caproni]